jgi:hypothetical protein
MRGAAVIGGSIAAHAVAIALLVRFEPEREPARVAEQPAQPVAVEIVPAPIEVAVIDESHRRRPADRSARARARRAHWP